jgi:hypothetical protein
MAQAGKFPRGHEGPFEYRGTVLGPKEIDWLQRIADAQPTYGVRRLAEQACQHFGWLRPNGEPAKMSCAVFLLALAKRGVLRLPREKPDRRAVGQGRDEAEILASLGTVPGMVECQPSGPLTVRPIAREEWQGFRLHMKRYHYLGLEKPAGESLCYAALVGSELVALLMWSAPALFNGPRDVYLGWERRARERNLPWVVNNSRFLVLPWIRLYCIASQVLGANLRRLSSDWQARYGHRVLLAETFVDAARFRGTCYLASNWQKVGETRGWSRRRVGFVKHGVSKHVLLYPLHRHAVGLLRDHDLPGELVLARQARSSRDTESLASVGGT